MGALLILLSGESRSQTNTFVLEGQIDAVPLDVEMTPNGAVAVVRGSTGSNGPSDWKVSAWRTDVAGAGRLLPPIGQQNQVGRGNLVMDWTANKPMFSDAIAVTNERVVAIGSGDTQSFPGEDTTYVDILSLSYQSGAPQVSVLATHLRSGNDANTVAGVAHDVAITPDGSIAVVNSLNWIQVFELTGGTLLHEYNICGADSPGLKGPCSPYGSRNSVEVTNTRAVVTTGRPLPYPLVGTRVWVYIIDLTADEDPAVLLEYDQSDPALPGTNQNPHDIAITPDGFRAVVTATESVGLYDLTTATVIGTPDWAGQKERHWNFTAIPGHPTPDLWHSVEASNSRAVVLADNAFVGGPQWIVSVYDITSSLSQIAEYTGTIPHDTAWDLSLAPDGRKASIKTQLHDLAVLDVVNPGSTPLFRAGPTASSPYPTTSSGSPGINDATVVMAPLAYEPMRRWAAFMGNTGGAPGNQVTLRFYDLEVLDWTQIPPGRRWRRTRWTTPTRAATSSRRTSSWSDRTGGRGAPDGAVRRGQPATGWSGLEPLGRQPTGPGRRRDRRKGRVRRRRQPAYAAEGRREHLTGHQQPHPSGLDSHRQSALKGTSSGP